MEYVIRHVDSHRADTTRAAALASALKVVARRSLAATTLLVCTYGLLAAEVELAKLEGFPAAIVR